MESRCFFSASHLGAGTAMASGRRSSPVVAVSGALGSRREEGRGEKRVAAADGEGERARVRAKEAAAGFIGGKGASERHWHGCVAWL